MNPSFGEGTWFRRTESIFDEDPIGVPGVGRRGGDERQEFLRGVKWSRMLDPDRRPVSAPACLLGSITGCRGGVEIDVATRYEHLALRTELACEEPVADEVSLTGEPVDRMDAPGKTAMELAHSLGQATVRQPHDEVMVVPHHHPFECLPAVLLGTPAVEHQEQLILIVAPA